jgi:hypothetical protein
MGFVGTGTSYSKFRFRFFFPIFLLKRNLENIDKLLLTSYPDLWKILSWKLNI